MKTDYARVILVFHANRDAAISYKADRLALYRAVAQQQGIKSTSTTKNCMRVHVNRAPPPQHDKTHLSKDAHAMLSEGWTDI